MMLATPRLDAYEELTWKKSAETARVPYGSSIYGLTPGNAWPEASLWAWRVDSGIRKRGEH